MRPLGTILVGVDFSDSSKAALIEADYIALREGASGIPATERLIQKSPCSVLTVGAPDEWRLAA